VGGFSRTVVTSPTDADLAVFYRAARGAPRAVVCLLHDMSEHAGRYADVARVLSAAGLAVLAHDHRGWGETHAFDAPPGVLAARDGFDRAVEDAVFVAERARSAAPGLPLISLGFGFGGLVVLGQLLARPDVADGVAVWNADVDARHLTPARGFRLSGLLAPKTPDARAWSDLRAAWSKPFKPSRSGFEWLSRDEAEVESYVADPLCGGPPSPSFWRDVLEGAARIADDSLFGAAPRATPFLLLAGADDPVTGGGESIAAFDVRLRDMGFLDVARVILPEARHDTLHDRTRDEAIRLLLRWIDRVAAGQAAHA
jgi:alpha-beta hydrolase superfamily lysophospholipase